MNTTIPDKPQIFIGRERLIKNITWELINKKQVWLYGLPGIGKSTLALYISYTLANIFFDGTYWFRADIKNPQVILDELLTHLGYNTQGVTNSELKLNKLSQLIQGKNILIILDNITTDLLSSREINHLFKLQIAIICTSLEINVNKKIHRIKMKCFSKKEFMDLAEKILAKPFIKLQREQLNELGFLLGYLPISSIIVLKRIYLDPLHLPNYISQLKQNKLELSNVIYDNKNLYSAFIFTFNKLSVVQQKILISCSLFEGSDFSIESVAILNTIRKSKIKFQLTELLQLSFIDTSSRGRYRLHPAIRDILEKKSNKQQSIQLAKFYITKLKDYPIGSQKCLHYLSLELENVINLLDKCYNEKEYNLITSLWELISFYIFYTGKWYLIYKLDTIIQNSYKRTGNLKGLAQYILEDIGRIYFFQSNYKKLKQTFLITTAIAQKTNDSTLLGVIKSKQGIIYHFSNQLKKSERYFLDAIKILQHTSRREELAKAYAYLSLVYAKLHEYKMVIKYSNLALNEFEQVNNFSVWGFICVFLGLAFFHIYENKKAEVYLMQGYGFEKKYHIKIGQALGLHGLGSLYIQDGDKKKGIKYLEKALNLYSELGMKKEEKEIKEQILQ
jgi:tetratricopeptide (TPR) repeat protein